MNFSDEQIRDMLELKESTLQKIERHQKEIQSLEKQLVILDSIVKQSSFTKASSLPKSEPVKAGRPEGDLIPITRGGQGEVIANAYVTPERVSIILEESLDIDEETPPFKSFFVDRVIGEMKRKDSADGAVPGDAAIDFVINKSGSKLREIVVRNYRQKERVSEIISTAGWSLSRMLENTDR